MEIKKVGVLGCGLMGSGIAQVCATAGFDVTVLEVEQKYLDKGFAGIEKSLAKFAERPVEKGGILSLIHIFVLAGGMEAMSQAPFVIRGRDGFTLAPGGKLEDSLMVALLDSYCNLYMANTAELLGSEFGITREMQDEFALRSQQKADAAYKEGRIQEELVPVPLKNSKGEATGESLTEDDHRRPQTTLEGLAKLKAAFGKNGTVTAGNASGIVDLSLIHI